MLRPRPSTPLTRPADPAWANQDCNRDQQDGPEVRPRRVGGDVDDEQRERGCDADPVGKRVLRRVLALHLRSLPRQGPRSGAPLLVQSSYSEIPAALRASSRVQYSRLRAIFPSRIVLREAKLSTSSASALVPFGRPLTRKTVITVSSPASMTSTGSN